MPALVRISRDCRLKVAIVLVLLALLAVMALPSYTLMAGNHQAQSKSNTNGNNENQSGDHDDAGGNNHQVGENETGQANDHHENHDNETGQANDDHEPANDNDTEANEVHPHIIRFATEVDLTGAQQSPRVETQASGEANVRLIDNGTALRFELEVCNIANVTMAHIHVNATGPNGPVVLFLYHEHSPLFSTNGCADLSSGTLTGANLTAAPGVGVNSWNDFVKALLAGNAYVNVHTKANGNGEIRGQLVEESKGEDDGGDCGPPFMMRPDIAGTDPIARPCIVLDDSDQ